MKRTTSWLLFCREVREEICRDSNYLCFSQGLSGCLSLAIFLAIMSFNQNEWMLLGGLAPLRTDVHLAVRQQSLCCHSDQSNAAAPLHPHSETGPRMVAWWRASLTSTSCGFAERISGVGHICASLTRELDFNSNSRKLERPIDNGYNKTHPTVEHINSYKA